MDRREFMTNGMRLGAAAWAASALPGWVGAQDAIGKSRVVIARDDKLSPAPNTCDRATAALMLTAGLAKLTEASSPEGSGSPAVWSRLFGPGDVVGIKVNCLGGEELSTHPALVDAIIEGLLSAGVKPSNIFIWDRLSRELEEVGFKVSTGRGSVRCFGTDDLPRGGYDLMPTIFRHIGSRFSRFVSRHCNALISVPLLKDHDIAGVSIGMKNFFGAIDNPNKYHDNNCSPYIAELCTHPYIRAKLRLVVCDAVRLQYDGGPSYRPSGAWHYSGLLLARDPVALDAVGLRLIERKRAEEKLPPLQAVGRNPAHVAAAAKLGLGRAGESEIEILAL